MTTTHQYQESLADREKKSSEKPIQLRFDDLRQVVVIGDDQDRFYTTVADAARACKRADHMDAWIKQVKEFLLTIHEWCASQPEIVRACYVTWCEGHYNVIVVTHGDEYRFDFDQRVTELNLSLVDMYQDIPVDAIQIPQGPEGALHSFIIPEKAIQPYGESSSARSKGNF